MTARDYALPVVALCAAIICYLIYIGKFIHFAGAALGIGWLFFKIAFAAALVFSAFFLLHPLTFMLRLRGTPTGQRGHVRFTHLFGLLWLDAGVDKRIREVRLGFWRWSWRIAGGRPPRSGRKPPSPPPSPPPIPATATPAPIEKAEVPSAAPVHPAVPPQPPATEPAVITVSPKDDAPRKTEEKTPEQLPPVSVTAADEPLMAEAPRPRQEPPAKAASTPASAPPLRAAQEEAPPSREIPFGDKIRADLRRLRRRAADGWRTAKTWLKLGMRGWRRASPLLKRLAADHWNGVHLRPSVCRVRYGLTEAHLTGLTQGLAAPFAGLLAPFSVRFEPIPVFTGPTLHVFVDGGLLIKPWRILWAWLVLLSTLDFWKALRDLWHWHKARSKTKE